MFPFVPLVLFAPDAVFVPVEFTDEPVWVPVAFEAELVAFMPEVPVAETVVVALVAIAVSLVNALVALEVIAVPLVNTLVALVATAVALVNVEFTTPPVLEGKAVKLDTVAVCKCEGHLVATRYIA